ncbi:MAG TPA: acyltransferase [Capillimicrobium sp.]|nr:acyltransferase [Capillimicrobium sp.]
MATHLDALDALRGVEILGVLAFHTGHLPGGFLGVDLFFVLSGYLITGRLLRDARASGGASPVAFWGRRARRLLPALAVVLGAVAVAARLAGPPDVARTALGDGPWVRLNLVNWHLLAESASYWDRFGSPRPFEHLWSIAVEEQFYLAWPVVVIALAAGALAAVWALADGASAGWLFDGGRLAHALAAAALIGLCVHARGPRWRARSRGGRSWRWG